MPGPAAEDCTTARRGWYRIAGKAVAADSPVFGDAVAVAWSDHLRPRCLCQADGVEMYVARLGDGYIVKRMPSTGCQHAPDCPSYEPPAEASGLGQVLGTAITEDPSTGETTLRLDFPLLKISGRSGMPPAATESESVASHGTKLSLRGLLHYLWDQAELTHWQPGFAGKRNWATVRKHLLMAAEHKLTRGEALRSRLYIPEVFTVEQRDPINVRRMAQWASAVAIPGKPQHLMLLIAEVKEIVPARFGFKAVVKHVPDQAFALDESLYRRLGRRFETELALWGATADVHMVMIATFGVGMGGIPSISELSLMPVSGQWMPVEDGFDKQLVDRLVANDRAFVKGLRYNLGADCAVANATLTDCAGRPPTLMVMRDASGNVDQNSSDGFTSVASWCWSPARQPLPAFPPRALRTSETKTSPPN